MAFSGRQPPGVTRRADKLSQRMSIPFEPMKLRHPDQVRQGLLDSGYSDREATIIVRMVTEEFGLMNPPEDEPVAATLRLLAMVEYFKELAAELDQPPRLPMPPAV
jgi:hypothetical protein